MFGIFRSGKFSLYNNTLNQEKNQEHFGYIDFMKITAAEDRPQQKNPPPAAARDTDRPSGEYCHNFITKSV